jgi:hypothetical protein
MSLTEFKKTAEKLRDLKGEWRKLKITVAKLFKLDKLCDWLAGKLK